MKSSKLTAEFHSTKEESRIADNLRGITIITMATHSSHILGKESTSSTKARSIFHILSCRVMFYRENKKNLISSKMKNLEQIIGKYNASCEAIRQKYMKEIVVDNINVPNPIKLKNIKLLIKNLKSEINDRVKNSKSEQSNFPSYNSHKLLLEIEEKEMMIKKLERMKELTLNMKQNMRRNSDHDSIYHSFSQTRIGDRHNSEVK